ncbi:nonsense-mediated mRNA decay factor SMG7-like isoform X1 [Rosa rugosa]|uniref:nonsense-mediated mRNA decay factor SMG7-like isoform X1 n=1 Tax=Rosa rugosa TaxID=74645 RepID=UPI002B40465C|nr:nonsense-mediated mRNA decay factor SMG7-like isoform X1 [Rosa rugosa]XP_062013133.1 nonsense-mediated mRNA decay factor SMG7-like isoform X1 [Rosa rugosa]XP_062013135.1 nonsense-mediated mRNA decay factor SMG7-like isoform X1 [Rosa rugosa]XP_062013136.1 nonsense-mediated mRNA decay factor SMG7-like isoform X1 [Rosa rugosa]XP_062013137.1 nonsense-mediated mRNA decay factor SMG7-like isoform X1 [Rosa rugosa]
MMAKPQFKDQREIQKMESNQVASKENQLWALIHAKGLLHSDVQDLYRKVRSCYENIILNDNAQLELQDIEYSLWKLYYKLIDEFRKRIKKSSAAPQHDSHIEGLKLFLSEGIQFYQNLIVKIRECYGLTEESVFYRKGGIITLGEQKKMQKCQFLCHRFLVCLGDLARYKEQYEKPDVHSRNWSVAATHYLEATRIWPDSGNPQNQLAVLAMYIGDELLALYHCIRSLAVKNPFPEAKDNLTLLFEKNSSSHLHSLSSECQFNFLHPSERSSVQITKQESNDNMLKAEMDTNLWSLMIRTLSFLHLKLSVDQFPCAFASTMRELDALMALDDTKLNATLESYQRMDSVRRGPYRVLQVVSVLIFIIQNLVKIPETKDSKKQNDMQHMELTQLGLTATFIFMGRFVERCLQASTIETCPLLPAVLVFVEWLVFILDEAETYGVDEKSKSAMSYFFGEFVDLLKQLNVNVGEAKCPAGASLWEDYELRGFAPVAQSHALLDFSSHWEHIDNYESGMDCRSQRIIDAAIKIASRSTDSQKWIVYDKSGSKFCTYHMTESNGYLDRKESGRLETNNSDVELKVSSQKIDKAPEECEKPMSDGENLSSIAVEEEEVILFRPLTRRNSAPVSMASALKDPTSPKHSLDQKVPSDECLRRATSLLIAQNPAQSDPFSFHTDMTHFGRNMSYKQQQPVFTDTMAQPFPETPITAGPPSLSAWVFDRGSLSNSREKSTHGTSKHGSSRLSPIEEVASESLIGLSLSDNEDSFSHHEFASTLSYPSSYTAPVPSAPPLLPDDEPLWFNKGISMTDNASDVSYSQASSYPHWTATQGPPHFSPIIPSFVDKYPTAHRMTSSEWLRQYRESHNLEHHGGPNYVHPPSNLGNLYGYDTPRFHHFNQRGNLAASNPAMRIDDSTLYPGFPLDPGFSGYQRTSLYGCGAVTDLRNEQQPLLHYLKEREKQLQRDPTVRGPYMDN